MKRSLSSFFFVVLLGFIVVGCGGGDGAARTSTDGASADAIREYEEAVAAMEQQDADSGMEVEAGAER